MTIQERSLGSVAVLDLSGRLVLEDGDRLLKDRVGTLLNAGTRQVILNVAEVSYVDSAGLGALVSTVLSARNVGAAIRLVNPTKKLVDLLSMARLLKIVDISESEGHALESFGVAT